MKLFGFDFSVSKPAMCFYDTVTKEMKFYTWPSKMDKKSEKNVSDAGVIVKNRDLGTVPKGLNASNLTKIHTDRSYHLAQIIADDVFELIGDTPLEKVHIATEGFSFMSKGNFILDLSGYKYVMLCELYKRGISNLYTYSPISGKSTARKVAYPDAEKGEKIDYSKTFMIDTIRLTDPTKHKFIKILCETPEALKKGSVNYATTVDDLVDSYWILRTMCERDLEITDLI